MQAMERFFPHAETTEGITVRVSVNYMADRSQTERARWFWGYHIRIENNSENIVQLLTRHWIITDGRGGIQHVDGEGVVGEQPILKPGESHDYVSGCPLDTPSGRMEGQFRMLRDDDRVIAVQIPRFPLIAPAVAG